MTWPMSMILVTMVPVVFVVSVMPLDLITPPAARSFSHLLTKVISELLAVVWTLTKVLSAEIMVIGIGNNLHMRSLNWGDWPSPSLRSERKMTTSVGVCLLMLVGDEVTAAASIANSEIDRTPTMVLAVWIRKDLFGNGIHKKNE